MVSCCEAAFGLPHSIFVDLLAYEDWRKIAPDARGPDDVLPLLENGHGATATHGGVVAIELEPLKE